MPLTQTASRATREFWSRVGQFTDEGSQARLVTAEGAWQLHVTIGRRRHQLDGATLDDLVDAARRAWVTTGAGA